MRRRGEEDSGRLMKDIDVLRSQLAQVGRAGACVELDAVPSSRPSGTAHLPVLEPRFIFGACSADTTQRHVSVTPYMVFHAFCAHPSRHVYFDTMPQHWPGSAVPMQCPLLAPPDG